LRVKQLRFDVAGARRQRRKLTFEVANLVHRDGD
jgi:hypothetical protein